MKLRVILIMVTLLFASQCGNTKKNILGKWQKFETCTGIKDVPCTIIPENKGDMIEFLEDGLAIYDRLHITYVLNTKTNEIVFDLAGIGLNLSYEIIQIDKKELHLKNKQKSEIERYRRVE